MESFKNITNGIVIPFALVGLIVGGIFFLGRIVQKVDYNEEAVAKVEEKLNEVPTRQEFNTLSMDLKEVKNDVKLLLKQNK